MGILIDIGIVLFMALCIFIGYKRGLIKLAIRFCALILAIVLTVVLYKPVAGTIMANTELDENISEVIVSKIQNENLENISELDKKENQLLFLGENYIKQAIEEKKEDIAKFVADSLTISIVETLTFISLLLIIRIFLIILNLFADVLGNMPIIKQFNKMGGTIVGIIEGTIIVYSVFAVLSLISPFTENNNIESNINKSFLGKMVYKNNIIVNTIVK